MNEPGQDNPDQPQTDKNRPLWQFAAGFLGWFLVNGLIWLFFKDNIGLNLLVFPVNLIVLIVLFAVKKNRKYAQGVLAAVGVNLLISLILGLFFNAFCFIPFFNRVQ